MNTVARSIRIEDEVWKSAYQKAQKMGVSLTFVIKSALQNFSRLENPLLIVDEGDIVLSSEMQEKMDTLGNTASEKVKERLQGVI